MPNVVAVDTPMMNPNLLDRKADCSIARQRKARAIL
jgi:hypothetical protein